MSLHEHPRSTEFLNWMKSQLAHAQSLQGDFYRVAGPRHTSAKNIVSGIGAFLGGGRWNAAGVMKVVYLSDEPETALREANENLRYFKLPLKNGLPKVIVSVRVELERILDLTRKSIRTNLPENWKTLLVKRLEEFEDMRECGIEASDTAFSIPADPLGLMMNSPGNLEA